MDGFLGEPLSVNCIFLLISVILGANLDFEHQSGGQER